MGAVVTLVLLGARKVSVTRQINTGVVEDKIKTLLQCQAKTPVSDVSCPEPEEKQGDVFECMAHLDGQGATFDCQATPTSGGPGSRVIVTGQRR